MRDYVCWGRRVNSYFMCIGIFPTCIFMHRVIKYLKRSEEGIDPLGLGATYDFEPALSTGNKTCPL